jgi:hypothetical protein
MEFKDVRIGIYIPGSKCERDSEEIIEDLSNVSMLEDKRTTFASIVRIKIGPV